MNRGILHASFFSPGAPIVLLPENPHFVTADRALSPSFTTGLIRLPDCTFQLQLCLCQASFKRRTRHGLSRKNKAFREISQRHSREDFSASPGWRQSSFRPKSEENKMVWIRL